MNRLMGLLLMVLVLFPALVFAQENQPYRNEELGIAFALPTGWEVRTDKDSLLAAAPEALAAIEQGGVPSQLVVSIIASSFIDMDIQNAADLPNQLAKLVPTGVTAPQPIEASYGNQIGWEIEYSLPDSNLSSRVALIALANGRLALVRGFSTTDTWAQAAAQFETFKASLEFFLPTVFVDPLADLPDDDGGVFWHYQAAQPADQPTVTLGGMAFDPFLLMYVAAGSRGILVLDQSNGSFVNYLGPFFEDDNFVDLAIDINAKIFLANATSGDNNQIMIVNRAGQYESSFGTLGDQPGQFAPGMPRSLAVTRQSDIWTISEGHSSPPTNRLYKFDRFGNLLKMIDMAEINPDLHDARLDNNIQTSGLYIVGRSGGLNLLDADGKVLVANLGMEVFSITHPIDVAIAPSGNIIVATDSEGFLEFAPSGALLDRFGTPYAADRTDRFQAGETFLPSGLAVDQDGMIYFAETNPATGFSQVQSFRFVGDGNLPLPNRPASGQAPALNLDPAAGGGDIAYGAVVQGSLNNQYPSHNWYFEGQAGDRLRITMRDISPNQTLDTRLVLLDGNQIEIAEVDDLGEAAPAGFRASDSVIEIEIKGYGFYTIQATRFGGRGEYELTLEKLNP